MSPHIAGRKPEDAVHPNRERQQIRRVPAIFGWGDAYNPWGNQLHPKCHYLSVDSSLFEMVPIVVHLTTYMMPSDDLDFTRPVPIYV